MKSTKKIKNTYCSTKEQLPNRTNTKSYKDKLIQTQRLCSSNVQKNIQLLNINEKSDGEDEMDGIPSVRISMVDKLRICSQWLHALIIKPYGKDNGFSYLDYKLRDL